MHHNPFSAFIDLVTFDACLRTLKKQHAELEQSIEDTRKLIDSKRQLLVDARAALAIVRRRVDTAERELNELDVQMADKKRRLGFANTPKEYFSVQQELDTMQQKKQQADDQLIAYWGDLEREQAACALLDAQTSELLQQLSTMLHQKEIQVLNLQQDITKKQHERSQKEHQAPAELLVKYTAMLDRIENPVVPVEQGSCSGCFYPIALHDMASLQRHKILSCKGCYRMLYHL